jgi:DnaJ-class molecular chaperone
MSTDYYQILGVGKDASDADIKKAFRKMAHQYHPDKKNGNEAKFKEVNEAYQVLKDSKKRQQYDSLGHAFEDGRGQGGYQQWQSQGSGFGGFSDSFDLGDIFKDLFQEAFKHRDQVISLPISFVQASLGATVELQTLKGMVKVKIPAGIQSGEAVRVVGKSAYGDGDLIIQITIKTHTRLSKKQKDLLKELDL